MATRGRSSLALHSFALVATPFAGACVLATQQHTLERPLGFALYVLALLALAVIATVASMPRWRHSTLSLAAQAASVALYFVLVMVIISSVGLYFALEAGALLAALVLVAGYRTPTRVEPR